MPPKAKITREDIVNAAIEAVRENGEQAINARTVAAMLNCSTQPIFSNFASIEELRLAAVAKADELCRLYIQCEVESGRYVPYKASGMAYIRFAGEERELFKLLYMRDRKEEPTPPESELDSRMEAIVQQNTGLEGDSVKLFHLEMWAFVHGIAAMFATGYLDLSWDLVSQMLTDAYQGLRHRYGME